MLSRSLQCFIILLVVLNSRFSPASAASRAACDYSPETAALLSLTSKEQWAAWIRQLSGEDTVVIDGVQTHILTRYSPLLFNGQPFARAYDFVREQVLNWYPQAQVEEDPFPYGSQTWKNLVVTLPGTGHPQDVLILSAHLDSTSQTPELLAPGAEDNASGSAALLEAARIFRFYRFDRTVRFIWFTGEEQGMLGSKAYVQDQNLSGVVGDINLDMFGYDSDNDHCFELHAGTLPQSHPIGQCILDTIQAYHLNLEADYITAYDMGFSDHSSFWEKKVGAVEVLDNFSYNATSNGCKGKRDQNPNYHHTSDRITGINLDTGFDIVRASLAAAAALAGPVAAHADQSSQPLPIHLHPAIPR